MHYRLRPLIECLEVAWPNTRLSGKVIKVRKIVARSNPRLPAESRHVFIDKSAATTRWCSALLHFMSRPWNLWRRRAGTTCRSPLAPVFLHFRRKNLHFSAFSLTIQGLLLILIMAELVHHVRCVARHVWFKRWSRLGDGRRSQEGRRSDPQRDQSL